MMNHYTPVSVSLMPDNVTHIFSFQANLTQKSYTAPPSSTEVLRQDATTADYGIILLLALVIAFCWARIGKK